jgi:hypothetical protein
VTDEPQPVDQPADEPRQLPDGAVGILTIIAEAEVIPGDPKPDQSEED